VNGEKEKEKEKEILLSSSSCIEDTHHVIYDGPFSF
jgi:hypothetical protein